MIDAVIRFGATMRSGEGDRRLHLSAAAQHTSRCEGGVCGRRR